jgi:hypothetical protein
MPARTLNCVTTKPRIRWECLVAETGRNPAHTLVDQSLPQHVTASLRATAWEMGCASPQMEEHHHPAALLQPLLGRATQIVGQVGEHGWGHLGTGSGDLSTA